MQDEIYQRELGWMELVSRAFFEFFQNIRGVLVVMVVVFLPVSLLESVIEVRLNAINSFLSTVQVAGTFLENEEGIMQALYHTVTGSLIAMAIELFLVPVGTIAIAKMVMQRINGEEPDVKTALKEALALEPTIIVAGFCYGALVTLGCLVFFIPGIWLSVLWTLYLYCIGLGGQKGWDSLRHSGELVRGRWWRTFGYIFALGCIATLWDMVFELVYVIGGTNYITTVCYHFCVYFSNAFVFIGTALLFINRESQHLGWQPFGGKKEADLEILE